MRSNRASVSVASVLLLVLAAGPVLARWGPIVQLTTTSDNSILTSYGQSIAVMGDHVHIVYADRPGGVRSLMYVRSTNRGENWLQAVTIEPRSANQYYSLAADSNGGVHLLNARQAGGLWYRRSTDNGETWLDAVELHADAELPVLTVTGPANVQVFDTHAGVLRTRRSTDGGANWGNWSQVVNAAAYAGLCGGSGGSTILLAYAHGPQGGAQTYRVRSTDGGQSWSPQQQISTTPQTGPLGIWTNGTNAWLSFTIFGASRNFRRSTDGGANWQSEQTLRMYVRSLVHSGDDLGAVGLIEDANVAFLRSTNAGANWSDTTKVCSPETGPRDNPRIATDDDGNAHVVWTSRETGTLQVYYRFGARVIGVAVESGPGARTEAVRFEPNPVRASVRLTGTTPVGLYNRTGARVAELRPGRNDIGRLPRGVYFARTAAGADAGKLVKLD